MKVQNKKSNLLNQVISEYTENDILKLVVSKIKSKNYIEAYSIADQYITESLAKILVIKNGELAKVRERLSVKTTLDIINRLGMMDNISSDYIENISKFKNKRNLLIHNSINSKPIKADRYFKRLPVYIVMYTDLLYFDLSIKLMKVDTSVPHFDKRSLDHWLQKNDERFSLFLSFLLNMYIITHRNKKNVKNISNFSKFLADVVNNIFPFLNDDIRQKNKSNKKFSKYLINMILRGKKAESYKI